MVKPTHDRDACTRDQFGIWTHNCQEVPSIPSSQNPKALKRENQRVETEPYRVNKKNNTPRLATAPSPTAIGVFISEFTLHLAAGSLR